MVQAGIEHVTSSLGSLLPRTGRAEQLGCLAAPERCSSQRVSAGLGCLKYVSSLQIPKGILVFICSCWHQPGHRHCCPWL